MPITRTTEASSLIVDNCWNGGAVVGAPKPASGAALVGITGRLTIGGKAVGEGASEDPCATLAWLANQFRRTRPRPQSRHGGHYRQPYSDGVDRTGRRAVFTVEGLGEIVMDAI